MGYRDRRQDLVRKKAGHKLVVSGHLVAEKTAYAFGSKSLFAGASHISAVMWWLVNGA